VQVLDQLDQKLWSSSGMQCLPKSLAVYRIKGGLDVYVRTVINKFKNTISCFRQREKVFAI